MHSTTTSMVDTPDSGLGGPRGGSNVPSARGDFPPVAGSCGLPSCACCLGMSVSGWVPYSPVLQAPHIPSAIVLWLFAVYHGLVKCVGVERRQEKTIAV